MRSILKVDNKVCINDYCKDPYLTLITYACEYTQDWYKINLEQGDILKVKTHSQSDGIYDMTIEIHDLNGARLKRSMSNSNDDHIEYTAETTDSYYIMIYKSYKNTVAYNYSMEVTIE